MAVLYFFMLQRYELPASWIDTADRLSPLKPRTYGGELDPVAEYCVRHMRDRMRKGQPKYRMKVLVHNGVRFREAFVVHIDGTRTPITDD